MLPKQITVYNGPFSIKSWWKHSPYFDQLLFIRLWCCLRANNNVDEWERIYIRTTEALNVIDKLQCYLLNTKHITLQRIKFLIFTLYQYLNPKVSKMAIPEYILTNPFLFNFMTVLSFQFRWTIKRNAVTYSLSSPSRDTYAHS